MKNDQDLHVWINHLAVQLAPGMQVKHAVRAAGLWSEIEAGKKVYDDWGNEVGFDGALTPGVKLWVK
jgi:hypothetical protein